MFLLGGLIGVTELLSRYKDTHSATFKAPWAIFYILLNGTAAFIALYLMITFEWVHCVSTKCTAAESAKFILLAGLGGMAVLRTAIMSISVQGNDVPVGPAAVIQILLNVADRGTDRARANARSIATIKLMSDVSFEKASKALPATCLALMQNVTAEEQAIISRQVTALEDADMSNKVKSILLGLTLMPIVGEAGLSAAIYSLGDEIKD